MAEVRQDYLFFEDTDFGTPKILDWHPYKHRRTPLMITLADPKIASEDIQKMMELGVNIVKFKTSDFTEGEKIKILGKVDKAVIALSKKYLKLDWPVTTCMELKTCTTKTGFLKTDEDYITLPEGQRVVLINDVSLYDKCTTEKIFVDNPYLVNEVTLGMVISISQDEIILRCTKIIDDISIECLVTKSGQLGNMCVVAYRGATRKARPFISKKDLKIITFCLEYKIDMILINYARHQQTIKLVKEYIGRKIRRPILLAGVCTSQGLENVDGIIKESDGIVFSREFLAYEIDDASQFRLLHIQKMVSAKCEQAGKPFFISGEVFRTALEGGEFVDSETSDVTNALLDGATGFILKECNDVDTYLEVIRSMTAVCCAVEPFTNNKTNFWKVIEAIKIPVNAAEACAVACAVAAHQSQARVIVIPTVTGYTAKILMGLRPAAIVITVSTKTSATKRLVSYRCVVPLMFEGGEFENWYAAVEARVTFAVEYAVKLGWLKLGDSYVTLQRGSENSAFCDMVRVWNVTFGKKAAVECPDDTVTRKVSTIKRTRISAVFK